MIIVNLMGGLGNQMFQYAAARALSKRHSVDLKVDTAFLNDRMPKENFTYRNFELSCFKANPEIAQTEDLKKVTLNGSLLNRVYRKLLPWKGYRVYIESGFNFNEDFLSLPKNTYLQGYWQSEKYFKTIRADLLEDFKFIYEPDENTEKLLLQLQNQNAVSVHVRRGDYINNAVIHDFHGLCDKEYYLRAIKMIKERVNNPIFYFFSDDIGWVKQEFRNEELSAIFIEDNQGDKSFEDMRLMSACKHNIIANSSFSWWGAWLNTNKDKIVIAPKNWFKDPLIDTIDLIPNDWNRM